jgi:hypothetical protein
MKIPASILLIGACQAIPAAAQGNLDEILKVVEPCDILAAHPDDPLRVAPGVLDEELVPRLAITACKQALADTDDPARHAFQLGRAQLELNDREGALDSFRIAAEAGSAIAMVFLGDAEQFGWVDAPRPEEAKRFYQNALAQGLPIADLALGQVTFDPEIFTTGAMLKVLVEGDMDLATSFARSDLAPSYLYALGLELSERCGSFLRPENVAALQAYRFPEGWSPALEEGDRQLGVQDVLATYDVEVLVDRHGCSGYVIETIADSYNVLLRSLAGEMR